MIYKLLFLLLAFVPINNNICPLEPPKAEVKQEWRGYPLRRGYWSGCPNWQHLTVGEHAGKFNIEWLKSLSYHQIQSLHADDHEGRVNWNYAVKGNGRSTYSPVYRRGFFRWK